MNVRESDNFNRLEIHVVAGAKLQLYKGIAAHGTSAELAITEVSNVFKNEVLIGTNNLAMTSY